MAVNDHGLEVLKKSGKDLGGGNYSVQVHVKGSDVALASSGSGSSGTASVVTTLTAPAGAIGFILSCIDTATGTLRWAIGRAASPTAGQQLQGGRSTGLIPCSADVSICPESGDQPYDIQWIVT